jgi:hypothetical protein
MRSLGIFALQGGEVQSDRDRSMHNRRVLSDGETAVLTLIQQGYGPQNSIDKVFFNPTNEAIMFVRLLNGMSMVMANLTNLAARRADGSISSDDELKKKWLRLDK